MHNYVKRSTSRQPRAEFQISLIMHFLLKRDPERPVAIRGHFGSFASHEKSRQRVCELMKDRSTAPTLTQKEEGEQTRERQNRLR